MGVMLQMVRTSHVRGLWPHYYRNLWIHPCAMSLMAIHHIIMEVSWSKYFCTKVGSFGGDLLLDFLNIWIFCDGWLWIGRLVSVKEIIDITRASFVFPVGYDGTTNEWEDYSRYMNPEGVEMPAVSFCAYSFMLLRGYSMFFRVRSKSIIHVIFLCYF